MGSTVVRAQELAPTPRFESTDRVHVRDGDFTLEVQREPGDPGSVVVSHPDGASFRARVDEHVLVRVARGVDPHEVLHALDLVIVREVSPRLRAYRVIDGRREGDGLALAARLAAYTGPGQPLVDAIPDWLLAHRTHAIDVPPSDARYSGQWYFGRIHIEDAWRISSGDPSTTIVVVDSGCDATHPDLAPKLDPGRDVIDDDDDPTPTNGNEHGTACAGLAAAATDNAIGIAGACPECRLRCVRLLAERGTPIPLSADVAAFQFALDVDAEIVSNSWGFIESVAVPSALRAIIEAVIEEGRGGLGGLVLFASGNDDRELRDYEIHAIPGVITVGAVNNFDEVTAYSNRGNSVDIVSPTGTLSTDIVGADGADPGDYVANFSGTSSACPIVAGVAGLLVSAAPNQSGQAISDALIETAMQSLFATPDEDGHDLYYGYGRVVPAAALRRVLGISETVDAGLATMDADVEPDAGRTNAPGGNCNCRVSAQRTRITPLMGLFVVGCMLVMRRRARTSL
jgi:subtilisin family serine protease